MAAEYAGWVLAIASVAKQAIDYAKSRGRNETAQAKADAAQTAADADLQDAVNRAVQIALKMYESRIAHLEAQLAAAEARAAKYKAELEGWESAGRLVNETLEKKRAEEEQLREQLVMLEQERNEKAVEVAKVRGDLDRAYNLLAEARAELEDERSRAQSR